MLAFFHGVIDFHAYSQLPIGCNNIIKKTIQKAGSTMTGQPDNDFSRQARYTLWINSALTQHYDANGKAITPGAGMAVDDLLSTIEDAADARGTARRLMTRAPANSDRERAISAWWLGNLQQDRTLSDYNRLFEYAAGYAASPTGSHHAVIAAHFEETLGQILTSPTRSQSHLTDCWKLIETQHATAPLVHNVLRMNASHIAVITPNTDLPDLLQNSLEAGAGELHTAALAQLQRIDLHSMQNWHDGLRRRGQPEIAQAISAHYKQRLHDPAQTCPTDAWDELASLEQRWNNGRPAILAPHETDRGKLFSAYAGTHPHEAAHLLAYTFSNMTSSAERLDTLANTQKKAEPLAPAAQLLFLGHLHASMMFYPDLAAPSRDHLVKLHQTHPDSGVTTQLQKLAVGDPVLQKQLEPKPAPPPPALPPPTRWQRLRKLFTP